MVCWEKFRALGSEAVIVIITENHPASAAGEISDLKKEIRRFEHKFSRFIKDNELDRLNRANGEEIRVSEELIDILEKAQNYYALTGKIFDPTIIVSLDALGYDKSFADLADGNDDPIDIPAIQQKFVRRSGFTDLKIDQNNSMISAPKGFKIDLGGIGKGYLADLMEKKIAERYNDYFVSLGGDLVLSGQDEAGSRWSLGVQNPLALDKKLLAGRSAQKKMAIATSGVVKRIGRKHGFEWHHLIDPRSGLPATNEILSATVFARTATMADVFAKTILILGSQAGLDFINRQPDCACLIVEKGLKVRYSEKAADYFITDEKNHQ